MQHSESVWPMYVSLKKVEKQVGRWTSISWELDQIVPATHEAPPGAKLVLLELFRDERASYRLNLDMDNPMLYIVCDEDVEGNWIPAAISADQNVAAGCLEGDTPVLNMPMPERLPAGLKPSLPATVKWKSPPTDVNMLTAVRNWPKTTFGGTNGRKEWIPQPLGIA